MIEDPRCCGSGTCIIDKAGRCWCGQQWDGQQMRRTPLAPLAPSAAPGRADPAERVDPPTPHERRHS
jgi:hypothetical protein